MSLEGGLDVWFIETLQDLEANGWRCVPIFEGGGTLPYGDGQTYTCPLDYLGRAVAIGVVLDRAILLDWDGNKPEAQGKIISLETLGYEIGADMGQPVQANRAGNSLHYLFKWREGFGPERASCDGWKPFVDLKTGNQIMALKPGKILTDGELPPVGELPVAGEALEKAFNGGYRRDKVAGDVIGRNSTLTSFVGSLIHEGVPVREVSARAMAKNQEFYEPLDEAEVLKVVKSVVSADVSKPENVASWGAMVEERDRSELDALFEQSALPSDLLAPSRWIVDNFMEEGCFVIAGARGAGKTTAFVPLAAAICGASKVEGIDFKVHRHVVYVAEDVKQCHRTLYGVIQRGANAELLRDRFHVFEAQRRPVERWRPFVEAARERYQLQLPCGELIEPLFVMDTSRACFEVDENANTEVSHLLSLWREYCGGGGGAPTVIINHTSKVSRDADVTSLASVGADAWDANSNGAYALGNMGVDGKKVIWGGAGIKRRDQGEIEAIEVNGEVHRELRDAGAWGQQEVGYVAVELRGLMSGERFEMIQQDKSEKEAQKDMVERGLLVKQVKEAIGNCEHLRKCDPTDEGGYATKQVIYNALGAGKGRPTQKISALIDDMVSAGELFPRAFDEARKNGVSKPGNVGDFYVLASSIGRASQRGES